MSFGDEIIGDTSLVEVFTDFIWESFLVFCDIFFCETDFLFYRFGNVGFYWRIVSLKWIFSWVISEVLQESDPVSLFEAFLALIATSRAIDIEMSLFSVTVFITVIEYAVSDDFFAGAIVIDSLF